jgi:hypothetical protein
MITPCAAARSVKAPRQPVVEMAATEAEGIAVLLVSTTMRSMPSVLNYGSPNLPLRLDCHRQTTWQFFI